jgi:hypothetical protein
MKHSIDTIKRLSGDLPDGQNIAGEFCREVMLEIEKRAKKITRLYSLEMVLDAEMLAQAANDLAGIRHLMRGVSEMQEFHHKGSLAPFFDSLLQKTAPQLKNAEEQYRLLYELFPPVPQGCSASVIQGPYNGTSEN